MKRSTATKRVAASIQPGSNEPPAPSPMLNDCCRATRPPADPVFGNVTRAVCAERRPRQLRLRHAVLELAVVFVLVVTAARPGDEAVVSERPLLEAGDPHGPPGTAGSRVRARKRPVVVGRSFYKNAAAHNHLEAGERADKEPRDLGALGGISAID